MSSIKINKVPSGHVVIGYVAHLKVLDENGVIYYASRTDNVGPMEALGLAVDLSDIIRQDLKEGRYKI